MSQSDTGPSRRRRKYASQACNTCRRRKTKCDGVQPICQPCTTSGHECSWSAEGNESSRPATKQYIESLRAKIQMLESEITQLKRLIGMAPSSSAPPAYDGVPTPFVMPIDPPGSVSGCSTPNMQAGSPFAQYIHLNPPEPSGPHPRPPSSYSQPSEGPSAELNQPFPPTSPEVPMSERNGVSPVLTYQYIFNIDSSTVLEDQPAEHQASLQCQWSRYLPDLGPIQLSRHEHDTLLSHCFSYGAGWLLGLIPDPFLRDMVALLRPNSTYTLGELEHYSPLLHCSLLAFAAPFSEDPGIRAKSTRGLLAACAKRWLDQEFNYSNPSLLPSLILLSEYHLGIGESRTGHMYIGMGMRAAQAKSLVAREMERPSEMPVPTFPIASPISLELSARSTAGDFRQRMFAHADYTSISVHCFIRSVELMLISAKIPNALQGSLAPIDVHIKLDAWFNSLPDALLIRQRSTLTQPPILALHIRYWWSMLDLYLPFFNNSDPAASQSVKICTRATEKLVKLLGAYDTQFGLQYLPRNLLKSMHTCARGLLLECSQINEGTKKRAAGQEGLDLCLRGLRTSGEIWSGLESLVEDLEMLIASSAAPVVGDIHN